MSAGFGVIPKPTVTVRMREALQAYFYAHFLRPRSYSSEVIFMQKHRIQYMAKVAILGALAGVIMLLECPLPFAPPFYQLNFSEIATLISGFALGPVAGVIAELIKICFLIISPRSTLTVLEGVTRKLAILQKEIRNAMP